MLINLSNHPSATWQAAQLNAAAVYGEVIDVPFPDVDPNGDEIYIQSLCEEYFEKIRQIIQEEAATVHIMGEITFTHKLVNILQTKGVNCIASTTERIVNETGNGVKETLFVFSRFRKYI
ncbi:MAG: CRISPR-associated protein [Prevotellaceae bacterium]|jgi:selenophosphate synthetase-related protein|nr:CRISPR-associated protein [Prevotellaceae bacterium]